jgi:hypothetical protein
MFNQKQKLRFKSRQCRPGMMCCLLSDFKLTSARQYCVQWFQDYCTDSIQFWTIILPNFDMKFRLILSEFVPRECIHKLTIHQTFADCSLQSAVCRCHATIKSYWRMRHNNLDRTIDLSNSIPYFLHLDLGQVDQKDVCYAYFLSISVNNPDALASLKHLVS